MKWSRKRFQRKNKAKNRALRNSAGRNDFGLVGLGVQSPFQRLALHFFCEQLRTLGMELETESKSFLGIKLS